jgi:hypothetical protein
VTGVALELREYLINELVKVQEGFTRIPHLTDKNLTQDEVYLSIREQNQLNGQQEALVRVGKDILGEQLWWIAHREWARRLEDDGFVLFDGEEASEPVDYSVMEFTEEEKDYWKAYIDDNMVVVDRTI